MRTLGVEAVFPLMLLDEKVTVPPLTWTPPPCKQQANVSLTWGRWEVSRSMRHVQTVVDRTVGHSCQARVEASASASLPWGDGNLMHNFSRSLLCAPPAVNQSDSSCAIVSRGKHVSNFPIEAMGTILNMNAHAGSCVVGDLGVHD